MFWATLLTHLTVKSLSTVAVGFPRVAQMDGYYSDPRNMLQQERLNVQIWAWFNIAFTSLLSIRRHMSRQSCQIQAEHYSWRCVLSHVKLFRVYLQWMTENAPGSVLQCRWNLFKCWLKEKTTDNKWVVVMGIIIKGADGLGGYQWLAGYF